MTNVTVLAPDGSTLYQTPGMAGGDSFTADTAVNGDTLIQLLNNTPAPTQNYICPGTGASLVVPNVGTFTFGTLQDSQGRTQVLLNGTDIATLTGYPAATAYARQVYYDGTDPFILYDTGWIIYPNLLGHVPAPSPLPPACVAL